MWRTFTHRPRSSKILTSPDGRQPSKTNISIGKREKARREGPDFRGPSCVEGRSFRHSTGVVSLNQTHPPPISPPTVISRTFFWLTGRFMIYNSRPEHVHTAPHPFLTTISYRSSYTAPKHRAQPEAAARAPRASATAYASNAQERPIRCSAPRRTLQACLLTFTRKHVWMALHALAQCRGVSGLESAIAIVKKRVCARIGACTARLRISEWRSG